MESVQRKRLKKHVARLVKARKEKKVDTKRLKDLADSLIREAKHMKNEKKKKQFYGTARDLTKCAELYKKGKVTVTQVRRVEKDAEAKLGHRREADRLRQRRHRAGTASTSLFGYENCDSVLEKGVREALPDFEKAKQKLNEIDELHCPADDDSCRLTALLAIQDILTGVDKFTKLEEQRETRREAARLAQGATASDAYKERIEQDKNTHQRIKQFFSSLEKPAF